MIWLHKMIVLLLNENLIIIKTMMYVFFRSHNIYMLCILFTKMYKHRIINSEHVIITSYRCIYLSCLLSLHVNTLWYVNFDTFV